jgi:multiple sugar transport system permease protein
MDHTSPLEKIIRGLLLSLVVIFFMFPIVWIFLMSFQTNDSILRIPPSVFFTPTLDNYVGLLTGQMKTAAGTLQLNFMQNLWNCISHPLADPWCSRCLCLCPFQISFG